MDEGPEGRACAMALLIVGRRSGENSCKIQGSKVSNVSLLKEEMQNVLTGMKEPLPNKQTCGRGGR